MYRVCLFFGPNHVACFDRLHYCSSTLTHSSSAESAFPPFENGWISTFLDQHSFLPYPAALTASSLHIWALLPDSEDLFVCDLAFPYLHKYNKSPTRSRTTPAAPASISALEWRRNTIMAFIVECLAKDVTVPSAR